MAIVLSVLIPILLIGAVVGGSYVHYSRLIDARLKEGPFRTAVNIYGSAVVLSDGDSLSVEEIEAELRLSGYEKGANKPLTFQESAQGLRIIPSADSGPGPVGIILSGNCEIRRIEQSGRDIKSWTAGFPLIENLSPGREKRRLITFHELPPVLVNAIVAVEDRHFFHHHGLDIPRIAMAAYRDVRAGRKEQGASTLTMQLVRGLWLQPDKKWKRKIAEAMMTVHLEREWSKEEIFAAYANQVFLGTEAGYNIHGFGEASRAFFGKDLTNLTLPEAALLAGMVQRPSYFNPYRNPEHAKERRDVVLGLMKAGKLITTGEYDAAVETPVQVVNATVTKDPLRAPYYLDLVSDELRALEQPDGAARSVYTTIDLNLQRAASEAVASGMSEVDKLLAKRYAAGASKAQAVLIALDPHTGEIKAMVGGRDYATSQLNRIFAKRPPGSVFKPFVYAAAMNTGIEGGTTILTPSSTVDDSAATFSFDNQTYRPANFRHESFGTMTLRQALAQSDNVAAVKVAQIVGFREVVAMARRAGLNGDIKATPSVALGSYAVTPFEIAGAYTVFANSGTWVKPQVLTRVQNGDGETILNERNETSQALDPRVTYLMDSMLEEVLRSGTAAGVRARGFRLPAAGKTGTSHDGWFAGFTSQLLCIVWVGFDDYQDLNLEGAKSALPIWTEFMKKATSFGAYRNAHEFAMPSGIVSEKICLESGKLAGDLCPQTTTDLFIDGTAPTEKCALHTAAAVPDPSDDSAGTPPPNREH